VGTVAMLTSNFTGARPIGLSALLAWLESSKNNG
jgi:hypothetical protein